MSDIEEKEILKVSKDIINQFAVIMKTSQIHDPSNVAVVSALEKRGYTFRTSSDTEVIVHGYQEWGEELWARLGHDGTLAYETWPAADPRYLETDTVTVVVQVNGKLRAQIEVPADAEKDAVLDQAAANGRIVPWLEGKEIVKRIYVPGKLVNLVVK